MGRARAAGVYAVVGSDSYLAECAVGKLLDAALPSGERGDSLHSLRGDETSWSRLLDLARTGSLFAERRAILVRGAEGLKGGDEGLQEYLEDPSPGVTLVLMAAKPDKRKTAWKRLLERAEVVSVEPLKPRALRAHVGEELRRRGLELGEEAVDELVERVGQDLRRLMGEIDKLQAFASQGSALSAEDVAAVLGRSVARPLYEMADALAGRKRERALRLLDEALEDGESPQYILGALYRALRNLVFVKGAGRAPWGELASRLRVPPFKVEALVQAGRQWSEADLRSAVSALAEADRQMKTSVDARVALLVAVSRACGAGRGLSRASRPGR